MDISAPCDTSFSEDVNNGTDLLQSCHHKHVFCDKSHTIDDNMVLELGNALGEILDVQDSQELVAGHLDPNEETNSEDSEGSFEGFEGHNVSPLTGTTHKVLNKYATFPSSTKSSSHPSGAGENGASDIEVNGQLTSANAAYTRSVSLPPSSELVSAVKGSREKRGLSPLAKLTVTWSPDVVDPPSTSLSHTVRGHSQHRHRSNKKYVRHKHKGKSSRGSSSSSSSSSEKKHYSSSERKHHRRYTGSSHSYTGSSHSRSSLGNNSEAYSKSSATNEIRNLDLRPKAATAEESNEVGNLDLHPKSLTIEDTRKTGLRPKSLAMNERFLVPAQESKCGSSFLRGSINKVLISSVTEAT